MIYLIGGPPRVGKSTLAHKISKRNRCPEISVDWLRSVVLPYLDGDNKTTIQQILFQSTSHDAPTAATDEATVLWPPVKSFIEDKARWQSDFVLDGIQILPKYVASLDRQLMTNITTIFLVKTDEKKILEGFAQVRSRKSDWLLKHRANDIQYLKLIAREIAERGRYFEGEAKRYGFRVVNTQNNYNEQINNLTEEFFSARKALRVRERHLKSK